MELWGITLDFFDKKTCALLPDLCLQWDIKYDELGDNKELLEYWEKHINNILEQTKDIVYVNNNEGRSLIYSANNEAIEIISKEFKDLKLQKVMYEDIISCETCVEHNYLA
ncbi:hypothetical protein Arnit_2854 [Arcobacter nitrofigilis DSM 7299]|uniref:Uncharacterized protein n=1 Tax=Arcobacter nitrofigilis (strain ATCC 33309 / DSM 7299 / CCUG 15893 / LMG 7604 / NCTC 12251 / CI) TaxID=572480 RepID=D5V782_ARCNC|nr:hypothetical protein [Arcobacter nitrofigilis]ADG94502.1 hypothetical protein Arnit_2854 [Arcobacter nitrofigilis DSM 7299]